MLLSSCSEQLAMLESGESVSELLQMKRLLTRALAIQPANAAAWLARGRTYLAGALPHLAVWDAMQAINRRHADDPCQQGVF